MSASIWNPSGTGLPANQAASIIYRPGGINPVTSDVETQLRRMPSAKNYNSFADYKTSVPSGSIWDDEGGTIHRFVDRVMVGSATRNDGKKVPTDVDWIGDSSFRNGIFGYITTNAVLAASAYTTGLAVAGYGRTSTGTGGAGEASIGVTGMLYNDYEMTNKGNITVSAGVPSPLIVSGVGNQGDFYTVTSGGALSTPIDGVSSLATNSQIRFHNNKWIVGPVGSGGWGLYSTVVRKSSKIVGPTHAIETDTSNLGGSVVLSPADIYAAGATTGLWIAAGGEATVSGGSAVGVSSAAMVILANDPATTGLTTGARWNTGILFHNLGIYGTDGSLGEGDAIVMSPGHRITAKNNSGEVVSRILTTNTDRDKAKRLHFSHFGLLLLDDTSGKTQFQIDHVLNAVNYYSIQPNTVTNSPEIQVKGDDADLNAVIRCKGSGTLAVFGGYQTTIGAAGGASALPATPVGYAKVIWNGNLRAIPLYNV